MPWFILSAVNVLSISVGSLYQKLAMKEDKSDPVTSAIMFQFLLTAITFVFALIKGYRVPPVSLLPFFLMSGSLYAIGTVAYFNAIKRIEVSELTILGGAGVLLTIIASFLFLHDHLTILQLTGAFLILAAVVYLNYSKNAFKLNTGAWLALLGAGSYGLAVVFDSYIIRHYDAVSFLPLACFTPGLLILLRYINRAPSIIKTIRHTDRNLVIYTFLYSIQSITFYLALQLGALVSQVSSISRASIILTVIFATIFLKETKHLNRKIIAAILTTIGVLLVS
jgi:drug/metabolite transporter (DMT)-like permease